MKIIEYRIFMPLTIEENLIGQLWSFAENSRLNTGGGEGVVIQANNMFEVPYDSHKNVIFKNLPNYVEHKRSSKTAAVAANDDDESTSSSSNHKKSGKKSSSKENVPSKQASHLLKKSDTDTSMSAHGSARQASPARSKSLDRADPSLATDERTRLNVDGTLKNGQYTHKLYFIASKLPWYVCKLLPKDSTIIQEKSWNMYPVVKTVLRNEYFKNAAHIELDTITRECPNGVPEENVHNLSSDELEKREVVVIDITDTFGEYKPDEDPTLFRSAKTGRGPLVRGEWMKTMKTPLICCYKLVHVEFKVFGLQSRVESYAKNMYKSLFGVFHRQVFCWMDKWCELDLAQVRHIEEELARTLRTKIEQGEVTKQQLTFVENEKE